MVIYKSRVVKSSVISCVLAEEMLLGIQFHIAAKHRDKLASSALVFVSPHGEPFWGPEQ